MGGVGPEAPCKPPTSSGRGGFRGGYVRALLVAPGTFRLFQPAASSAAQSSSVSSASTCVYVFAVTRGCVALNQLLERGLVADRVEVAVLGSKRTERFVAVDREPEMLDRVVCPPGEALAAGEVVERPRVLRMSLDQLAPLIGSLGVFA